MLTKLRLQQEMQVLTQALQEQRLSKARCGEGWVHRTQRRGLPKSDTPAKTEVRQERQQVCQSVKGQAAWPVHVRTGRGPLRLQPGRRGGEERETEREGNMRARHRPCD